MGHKRVQGISLFRLLGMVTIVGLMWLSGGLSAAASPDDLVLSGQHSLTLAQQGDLLIAELRCAACHGAGDERPDAEKSAPNLTLSVRGLSPEYLKKFLADPAAAHPGTTMPNLAGGKTEAERAEIAESLSHFLVSQSTAVNPEGSAESDATGAVSEGRQLYHTVGCVACHGAREPQVESSLTAKPEADREDDEEEDAPPAVVETSASSGRPIAFSLGHVAAKYSASGLSEFLFQPLRIRSSGRMPDMKLTRTESRAIADYLCGEQGQKPEHPEPDAALVARGRQYFRELNCAACHAVGGISAAEPVVSLWQADTGRGCLSGVSGRHPEFLLTEPQKDAIRSALKRGPAKDTDQDRIAKTLTAFSCIACHVRDNFGGVAQEYNDYFVTSEKNLGDDGRIPPPLTLVGAKLQPAWLKKVLFDGESVRPYMATRMPQYGVSNLGHLPEILARTDIPERPALSIPSPESRSESEREREKMLRTAGRELLGDKGLNCIACHNFNGKPAPVNRGIDIMTSSQRLQSGWFSSFVRNPGTFRPRIIMPNAWPGGIAVHQTILEGNTDLQIEAIWYYLSLGTSAADPSGIRRINTKLEVGDEARTYRGRSRVAGYRGIAVGLPEKISYAFNAETGTLSSIWTGEFISVDRNGQGSGGFNPSADPIMLAQDVSFVRLANSDAPWPLLPVMTKEAKVNPDPLYPKNQGYQFRGYSLESLMIPTFRYQTGAIEVEDRTVAGKASDRLCLTRTLRLTTQDPQELWFRALTGEITAESEQVYRVGRLRLRIPAVRTKLRPVQGNAGSSELLLHLEVPRGSSTMEMIYEPL